jgi:hypothetical protein
VGIIEWDIAGIWKASGLALFLRIYHFFTVSIMNGHIGSQCYKIQANLFPISLNVQRSIAPFPHINRYVPRLPC